MGTGWGLSLAGRMELPLTHMGKAGRSMFEGKIGNSILDIS